MQGNLQNGYESGTPAPITWELTPGLIAEVC